MGRLIHRSARPFYFTLLVGIGEIIDGVIAVITFGFFRSGIAHEFYKYLIKRRDKNMDREQ